MVTLVPNNDNPTHAEIDDLINTMVALQKITTLEETVREIQMKQSCLHPAEQYFYDTCMFEVFEGKKQYK